MRTAQHKDGRRIRCANDVLHLAIVASVGDVVFIGVAASTAALMERVADYVRVHAEFTLWPEDARRVSEHLRAREFKGAVDAYFSSVGERWDPEHLHTLTVAPTGDPDWAVGSGLINEHTLDKMPT